MADNKEQVAGAIVRARDSLEQALSALQHLHLLDPSAVAFSAHALNNYLTLTGGTIELLLSTTVVTNAEGWYLGSRLTAGGWNHATDR